MKTKLIKIGVGGVVMGTGLAITTVISPVLLLSTPLAAVHAYKKIRRHPGINNPHFETNPLDSALVIADCTLQGLQLAIEPLRGSLDIALLGATIMVED